ADGALSVATEAGVLRLSAPVTYQVIDGAPVGIESAYQLDDEGRVRITLAAYDPTVPLVIDPTIQFSTFLGGSGQDLAYRTAVDAAGNTYLTGETDSANFPTAAAYQAASGGGNDAFIAKFGPAGQLMYVTYLGGPGRDAGYGID